MTDREEFRHNDWFDISDKDTKQFLIEKLLSFAAKDRNGHMHQDNIYTPEEVYDIRESALQLYVLILGSFRIEDEDFKELEMSDLTLVDEEIDMARARYIKRMIPTEKGTTPITDDELEKEIISWIGPILKYDMPEDTEIIGFNVVKFVDYPWRLSLVGLKGIEQDKYDTVEWNYNQTYTSALPHGDLYWETEHDSKSMFEQLGVRLRKIINSKTEEGRLLRAYSEVVLGDMKVREVLYKK